MGAGRLPLWQLLYGAMLFRRSQSNPTADRRLGVWDRCGVNFGADFFVEGLYEQLYSTVQYGTVQSRDSTRLYCMIPYAVLVLQHAVRYNVLREASMIQTRDWLQSCHANTKQQL